MHNSRSAAKARKLPTKIGRLAEAAVKAQRTRAKAQHRRRVEQWSASEYKIVMQLYPDYQEMMSRLPHRSLQQLKSFASCYGITKKRHTWKTTELKELKHKWEAGIPLQDIADHFGFCTVQQLKGVARHYKYFRPKSPLKPCGNSAIDAIRAKCDELGYSMVDLDEWCKSKRYWAQRACMGHQVWQHIHKAAQVLGGELTVTWLEPHDEAETNTSRALIAA